MAQRCDDECRSTHKRSSCMVDGVIRVKECSWSTFVNWALSVEYASVYFLQGRSRSLVQAHHDLKGIVFVSKSAFARISHFAMSDSASDADKVGLAVFQLYQSLSEASDAIKSTPPGPAETTRALTSSSS